MSWLQDPTCRDGRNPKYHLITALLKDWVARNSEAAWRWAIAIEDMAVREEFSEEAPRFMTRRNPDRVAES
jgi:hypothetical protein